MGRRLRVFVSSTMLDLPNERDAVRRKLREFNFEPVAAEAIPPSGRGSWAHILRELEDCDLFLLILAEKYGWIPTEGPGAGEGRSVTEMEYSAARRLGLPIFPFFRRGGVEEPELTAFKQRVADWADGHFRAEFDLAHDLAESVAHALVIYLGDEWRMRRARPERQPPDALRSDLPLPTALVSAVRSRDAVLFVGSGMSLSAGLPSAALFAEAMEDRIRQQDPGYQPPQSGTRFNVLATDIAALQGADELRALARKLVEPEGLAPPSAAHATAGTLFDLIFTTNYDRLLERALGAGWPVVSGEVAAEGVPGKAIVKLHGSVDRPENLVLTEEELTNVERTRPRVWKHSRQVLAERPVIVVGTLLRDPSIVRLFESVREHVRGWSVLPRHSEAERHRLRRWNIEAIDADAESFFATLRKRLEGGRARK